MKNEIKVGSRVRCVEKHWFAGPGEAGTVIATPQEDPALPSNGVAVEWDNDVDGHECGSTTRYNGNIVAKHGHGEYTFIDHLELITEESDMKFKIGDRVRVVLSGSTFSAYPGFIRTTAKQFIDDYMRFYAPDNGDIGVVVGSGQHESSDENLYVIYTGSHAFVIGENGIELTETKPEFVPHLKFIEGPPEKLGSVGEPTKMKDSENKPLYVGDVVALSDTRGENYGLKFVAHDSTGEAYVMGIKGCYDVDSGKFRSGFIVKKVSGYETLKHGDVIEGVKYIGEESK